jgi:disease resistance protein RPM1
MKQIEGELSILQAFIAQVTAHRVGDKAFDAWLDQVRDVAHEVEDIIDEYAYLAAEAMDTGSFFKRMFRQIKNLMKWQKFPNQISQVEVRIQRIAEMRNRYGISVGELERSNKLQHHNQPDSAYLTDSSEIVGNVDEIERLMQWLVEDKQDQTLIAIFGMGGLGKTIIASSVYKDKETRRKFDCHAWVTVSQTFETEEHRASAY